MGKTFYIFRHGLTYHAKHYLPYGEHIYDAEILEEAIPPLERMGDYLKNIPTDKNVTSPFLRCLQTVEIIQRVSGKEFEKEERLKEDVEGFDVLEERVRSFVEEINKSDYTSIAICTHGAVIGTLKHLLVRGDVELSNIMDYPIPGVLTIIKDGKIEEIDFNDV